MSTRKISDKINFEKAIEKLTALVETMEVGNITLEQSLKYFEEGVELIRFCQEALSQAEQKVEILTKTGKKPLRLSVADEH